MKGIRDGIKSYKISSSESFSSQPLVLDIEDFKGEFSFDALFGNLVNELLPSFQEEDADSSEGNSNISGNDALPNGRSAQGLSNPLLPEVDSLLSMFKNSCSQLVELRKQIDGKLYNLKKDVTSQDSKHRKTLGELEKGVDGLFDSFARLDTRISSVGQTAAKIGDHLKSADSQRETASQTMELIKYLMEFNSSPGDLMELSPLFSDDSRVAEAASTAQKLRSFAEEDIGRQGVTMQSVAGNARGLEVAVGNLQEYCNELENRLLSRFDAASQKRELSTMAECAKILSQVEDYLTRRINRCQIIISTFRILIACFILCLFIGKIVLDVDLLITNVGIHDMYVNFNINKHTITVEANCTLGVSFKKKGYGKPSADFGSFNLTTGFIKNHSISVFSKSTYQISGNDQPMVVKFDPYQTHLSEKEIRLFQKRLSEGLVWINLDGDFKWHQGLLVFENTKRHIHFTCSVLYKALPLTGKPFKKCEPRL